MSFLAVVVIPSINEKNLIMKKSVERCSAYLSEGIAKYPIQNRQSIPTLYRIPESPCRMGIRQT